MVWSKDIQTGQIRFLTSSFEETFEVPMEVLEENPERLQEMIHPEDAPFMELYSKTLLSFNYEQIEYRIVSGKGNIRWISERKVLVKNEVGEIVRMDALLQDVTHTKESELRLRDSEATFRKLFYQNPSPMWVYDSENLHFLAVNDAAIQFYGYTSDEFFRMSIRQIRPEDEIPVLMDFLKLEPQNRKSGRLWKHKKKDGSLVHVRIASTGIVFRGRQARLVLAIDLSRQVEAEVKMEKVYRYLQRFQEAVSRNSLLALLDSEGMIQFVNDNLLHLTGLKSEQLMGRSWEIIQASAPKSKTKEEMRSRIRNRENWRGERRFVSRSGKPRWVSCSIIPILEVDESAAQFLLLAEDISIRKEAERRNREYAAKLHNMLEGVTDAFLVLDGNWFISNMNLEAEKFLGKDRQHLIGRNFWEIFPNEEATRIYQFFRKARKSRTTVRFEEFSESRNQWLDVSIFPSKEELAVIIRDVTERKAKEEERREMMEQLISQNRDLEEFTFITSHSLRAQIANISMLCAAIDASGLTPSNQEIFEKIFQSSANLDNIIEDLNTILTVKERNSLQMEPVEIAETIRQAMGKLPIGFHTFRKNIHLEMDPDLRFRTVRSYLETILVQILTNAIKFRSLEVELSVHIRAKGQAGSLLLEIEDNGRGLNLEMVGKQVFHLYKTFHAGISGRGLGLYLCKILCDELQGSIQMESTPGKGSLIRLKLPDLPG